jgi:hypothetical protein
LPGLVPGIHVSETGMEAPRNGVGGRDKPRFRGGDGYHIDVTRAIFAGLVRNKSGHDGEKRMQFSDLGHQLRISEALLAGVCISWDPA